MSRDVTSSSSNGKTVSLVLGSGGARGLTHIGVIRELEEQGYKIAAIAGCSIGALVGGVYAAGKLDNLEKWFSGITKLNILRLLDFSWSRRGLVKGDRIIDALIDVVGDVKIEELSVPYTAVATDIGSGHEVWLRSGQLFDAIRASASLPMFFTPFEYNGRHLIDGGVVNPVPIAPTFNDHTDITIAVNLGGPPSKEFKHSKKSANVPQESSAVSRWINSLVNDIHDSLTTREDDHDWGAYDVANQAFDAMQATIARQKLASYPPDQVIEIPRNVCTTLEFDRAAELIDLGRQKARAHLAKVD